MTIFVAISKYENSTAGILKSPELRGITVYSIIRVPVTPVVVVLTSTSVFGSYTSKSPGNFKSGSFIYFKFPLPLITILYVKASLAFGVALLIDDLILKMIRN